MKSIKINDISKNFGDTKALSELSLEIEENKIYGLLGRNGAGKTTLLNIITNKMFPNSGSVEVFNENVYENDKVLSDIFYMTQNNLYPENIKIRDLFKWCKEFYPFMDVTYANKLADKFDLNTRKKVKGLSTGYSSILKLILALSSNAKIILLDEPVLGLDANHRDVFYKELLLNYENNPKTIILSTHLIQEIKDIIEEVVIIKKGKLIVKDSVENLLDGAYIVSGEGTKVDEYISNKECIDTESLGRFKRSTILEKIKDEDKLDIKKLNLDIEKAELQKLFINMTN